MSIFEDDEKTAITVSALLLIGFFLGAATVLVLQANPNILRLFSNQQDDIYPSGVNANTVIYQTKDPLRECMSGFMRAEIHPSASQHGLDGSYCVKVVSP